MQGDDSRSRKGAAPRDDEIDSLAEWLDDPADAEDDTEDDTDDSDVDPSDDDDLDEGSEAPAAAAPADLEDVNLRDYLDDEEYEAPGQSDDARASSDAASDDDEDDDESDDEDDEADDDEDDDDADDDDADDDEDDEEPEVVSGGEGHLSDRTFESLGMKEDLLRAVYERGYKRPTPVQVATFELAVKGRDLVVRSKTGTGKTAAFLMPIIQRIKEGDRRTRMLILTPTRELALQIAEEAELLCSHLDLRVVPVYGGVALKPQVDGLQAGAEIVVGTPGRILDHLRRGTLDVSRVSTGVLDEADEMLSMGFYEDVTTVLQHFPREAQLLLFSATVDASITGIINRYMNKPKEIMLSTDVRTVEGITHKLVACSEAYPKARTLLYTLFLEEPESAIIFCNTRADTTFVANYLNRQGFDAEAISSDLTQKDRERVMGRIKRGDLSFLVATDLASRGIDISNLSHVINYDLPQDPNIYLHRVGRTGRAGKLGTAVSLYSGRDLSSQIVLERDLQIPFQKLEMPSADEASRVFLEHRLVDLRKLKDSTAYESFMPLARTMVEELDPEERDKLFATALRIAFIWKRVHEKGEIMGEPAPYVEQEDDGTRGRRSERRPRREDEEREARPRRGREKDRDRGRGRKDEERRPKDEERRPKDEERRPKDEERRPKDEERRPKDEERRPKDEERRPKEDGRARSAEGRGDAKDRKPKDRDRKRKGADGRSTEGRSTEPRSTEARSGERAERGGDRRGRGEGRRGEARSGEARSGEARSEEQPRRSPPRDAAPAASTEDIDLNDWLDDSSDDGDSGEGNDEGQPVGEDGAKSSGNARRGRGRRRGGRRRGGNTKGGGAGGGEA